MIMKSLELDRQRTLHASKQKNLELRWYMLTPKEREVRGGRAPRIKRLSEYIGQSYFEYLAGLDDLVMIMDESHRYRASAGFNAI